MFFFDFSDFFYKITYFLSRRSKMAQRSGFKSVLKLSAEESGGAKTRERWIKDAEKIGGVKAHWERGCRMTRSDKENG